jgi:hypothetical protein
MDIEIVSPGLVISYWSVPCAGISKIGGNSCERILASTSIMEAYVGVGVEKTALTGRRHSLEKLNFQMKSKADRLVTG